MKGGCEGRFRKDLLFRLNMFLIHLPPLRDRRDSIPFVLSHFPTLYKGRRQGDATGFAKATVMAVCG